MKLKTFLLTALCLACTSTAFAAFTDGEFIFREGNGSNCTLLGYTGAGGDVTIPSVATNGATTYTVTDIGYGSSYTGDPEYNYTGGAFKDNTRITSVTIPNSVTFIGNEAFSGCHRLASVTIPNSVTTIGSMAFYECTRLSSITIPNSVTVIEESAFMNCNILASVTISNSITAIKDWTFEGCHSLASITIPNSVTSIGDYAFDNCRILASVTIPNSVTSIGDWAFCNCYILTSVTIPNSVTVIGRNAFSGCRTLASVTIPNSVTDIGESAFSWCEGLTSITIPNSVTFIDERVFEHCGALKNVTVSWAAPQSIYFDLHLFESVNIAGATLNVPVGTKALYQAHELWGQFGTITEGGGTDGISGISDEASPEVTISDRILTVSSPAAEQIEIYSFTGAMLYNAVKASGEATFNLTNLPKGALIVRGSSGWTQKIIRK